MKFLILFYTLAVFASTKAATVTGETVIDYPVACVEKDCSQIGVWDQDLCDCIQIVCDPAYGCAKWLGYPTCKCTECITDDPCPNGQPRTLDTFCQCDETPIPVCDPMWPPPFPANQWLPYPDCEWACIEEKCPTGKRWSTSQCKCVCEFPQRCSSRRFWDENDCACKCREPCQTCAEPQVWSESSCKCKCEKKTSCVSGLTYWDEQSCGCACYSKPRECCNDKIWSNSTCSCECQYSCKCAPNYVWDPYTCNCVCPNKPASCSWVNGVYRYFDDGSCMCLCENAKYSRCAYGFDHSTCSCRPAFCAQQVCAKGFEWDKYQCKCVSNAPQVEPICVKTA